MRNDFKAKEVQKLIGCGPHFIPAITKRFRKREKPIFEPTYKGSQGKTSRFTTTDVLLLYVIYEGRKFGLQRYWINEIQNVFDGIYDSKLCISRKDSDVILIFDLDNIMKKISQRIKQLY